MSAKQPRMLSLRLPSRSASALLVRSTCPGGLGMEPSRLFPIIVLLSVVTVEYGGRELLGFPTGRGTLAAFRERFLAAGHTHAGVLLVLSPAYFVYLGRTGHSAGVP